MTIGRAFAIFGGQGSGVRAKGQEGCFCERGEFAGNRKSGAKAQRDKGTKKIGTEVVDPIRGKRAQENNLF